MNYGVWDIDRGLLIKLGEGKEVLAALKGRRQLSEEEIKEVYGAPVPRFEAIEWPNLKSLPGTDGPNYWTLTTHFDACKAPQILMGIELINAGKVDKTYQDLAADLRKTIDRQFLHWTDSKILPAKTYGTYFPPLFNEPENYITLQQELREVLRNLREQGKFLFICTNSHWEYAEHTLAHTLGRDWRRFFDMVFCNAQKPGFFRDRSPMYLMDRSKADFRGKKITKAAQMKGGSAHTYLNGHCHLLTDFLKAKLSKEEPRVAYFGDSYVGDIHYCNKAPGWDSIAIIPELSTRAREYAVIEAASPLPPLVLNPIPHTKYWTDDFFVHSIENPKKNYFIDKVSKNCRYALPFLRHITNFMNEGEGSYTLAADPNEKSERTPDAQGKSTTSEEPQLSKSWPLESNKATLSNATQKQSPGFVRDITRKENSPQLGQDPRKLNILSEEDLFIVSAHSAGYNAGDFAQITINQKLITVERNENDHYRGLHVVLVNPQTGEVELAKAFDTYKAATDFDKFVLNKWRWHGYIVAAACKDECAAKLSLKAKYWFQRMGSKEIWNLGYRQGFSFIGVIGRRDAVERRARAKKDRVSIAQLFKLNPDFKADKVDQTPSDQEIRGIKEDILLEIRERLGPLAIDDEEKYNRATEQAKELIGEYWTSEI